MGKVHNSARASLYIEDTTVNHQKTKVNYNNGLEESLRV
jgi:hypothetical protein